MKTFAAILWFLTLSCWGLLLFMTHAAPRDIAELPIPTIRFSESIDHMLAFGFLAGLLCLGLWAIFPQRPYLLGLSLPALLIYAFIDEKTRRQIGIDAQHRHIVADVSGAIITVVCIYVLYGMSRLFRRSADQSDVTERVAGARSTSTPGAANLGSEVEAALSEFGQSETEVVEPIIRVEKIGPSGNGSPTRRGKPKELP